ncbi:hypothetical protein [Gluconobacter roseus]|uniref:hypothetical protein n=1 Tax=Gluconobacter roseus TaxID=586239 RepID=UPI0038D1672A
MSNVARERSGKASGCGEGCGHPLEFADAIVAGDLSDALAGRGNVSRNLAIKKAHHAFADGFSITLLVAAAFALFSSILVYALMRPRKVNAPHDASASG